MMFLDDPRRPIQVIVAHVKGNSFVYLSVLVHAALLTVLYYWGSYRIEVDRRQRSIESGERLTELARLERRVNDMARIKSLLEQSAEAGAPGQARNAAPEKDQVQFSVQPRAADQLLEDARELSRAIEKIEREIKAEELARLLDISKQDALERVAHMRKPKEPSLAELRNPAEAAATIEHLESKSRDALEQRRQQLEQQHNGVTVTTDELQKGGTPRRGSAGRHDTGSIAGIGRDTGLGGLGGEGGPGHGKAGGVQLSSVLGSINDFTNSAAPDEVTQEYTAWGSRDFFKRGDGRIPDLDAVPAVKGAGRLLGPGGTYANRVYVNRWYLIGPFEGKHGEGIFSNYSHPPEQAVVLDAVYRGKGERLVKWEYINMARYPLNPSTESEDAVYYGYTELMVDAEQDLTLWVGADDDAQLWVNDRLVWTGGADNKRWFFGQAYGNWSAYVRAYNLTEGKRVVRFNKGRNKLFFKLSNGPTRLFFSLVLTK